MTRDPLLALALVALLVFWLVGAYNRLVALRNGIGHAWVKMDDALRQRGAAALALLAALRAPLATEAGALDTLQAALTEAAGAAAALGARPVVAAHAAAWLAAEAAVASAASRVLALLDQHHALRLDDAVAAPAALWRDAGVRLAFARQLFNDAALAYDDAIALFPTRLLVPLFGFGKAGRV